MSDESNNTTFTKQMRLATRDIHSISDALINAKLAFALSDDFVWGDGLLIFYEIFKYLEENVPTSILPLQYHRRNAFEDDLEYYLGSNWRQENPTRKAVQEYLNHLKYLKESNPTLLIAYVYHLYMGLLSGGQILQKKRQFVNRLKVLRSDGPQTVDGVAVTDFGANTIRQLKTEMRSLIDNLTLSAQQREAIIEESRKVFEFNNKIVETIRGVRRAFFQKVGFTIIVLIAAYYCYKYIRQ